MKFTCLHKEVIILMKAFFCGAGVEKVEENNTLKTNFLSTRNRLIAAKLVVIDKLSVYEVSEIFGVSESSIYQWSREFEKYGENAFPLRGSALYNAKHEIRELKKENHNLKKRINNMCKKCEK